MGVVVGDISLIIFLVVLIGVVAYRMSRRDDIEDANAAEAESVKKHLKAKIDAKRFEPGTPLKCLNCDHEFLGPLSESGCPNCNKSSLVVTLEELRNASN